MSMHIQAGTSGMGDAIRLLPPSFMPKVVDNAGAAAGYEQKFVFRKWADWMQQFGGGWETQKNRARQYYNLMDDHFWEQHAPNFRIIETFNEVWAASQNAQERQERIDQDRAFAVVWNQEWRTRPGLGHIRVALMSAAVGNDLPRQSAVTAIENDCYLNYHPYVAVYKPIAEIEKVNDAFQWMLETASYRANFRESNQPYRVNMPEWVEENTTAFTGTPGQRSSGDWRWCSGRWHFMEQEWGLKPRWILSEAGPCRDYTGGLILDPQGGWKLIWGNEGRAQMVDMMRQWLVDVVQTPAFNEGRIAGFHQFTTGGGNTWKWFEVAQPELNMVAELTASMWTVQPPPPPPPPPPPHQWAKVAYLAPNDATMAEMSQVLQAAYATKSEISMSADNAFARPDNVTTHKVIVYAPERWGGKAALENWVDANYAYSPATNIEYRNFTAGFELVADISQWQGHVDWQKMREKMQDEGLE